MEVPQQVQGQSPSEGLGAKPPEARYAYTICSGQPRFCDVFIEDIWCTYWLMQILLPPPYSSKKLFEFMKISRPTLAEVGWGPTVATPLPRPLQTNPLSHRYATYTWKCHMHPL